MIFEQEIVYEDGYAALDELCGYLLTQDVDCRIVVSLQFVPWSMRLWQ